MMQTTLRKEVRCSGVGLHSGRKINMVLRPAPADTGAVFSLWKDGHHQIITPAPERIVGTGLATTLGNGSVKVATIEHLLGALVGLNVDNVLVEVDGEEIPILDGSALGFVYLLGSAGLRSLNIPRKVAKIARPLVFSRDGKRIAAYPYNGLRIDYIIQFDHPRIGRQYFRFDAAIHDFASSIARARTFGFMKDVEWLQKNGLALGGSLDNAVVFDENGPLNPEGLRFADEMVRHKILDFMGDTAVGSHRLWGHFEVSCSGHEMNNQFMRHLFAHASEYLEFAELGERERKGHPKIPVPVSTPVPAWA